MEKRMYSVAKFTAVFFLNSFFVACGSQAPTIQRPVKPKRVPVEPVYVIEKRFFDSQTQQIATKRFSVPKIGIPPSVVTRVQERQKQKMGIASKSLEARDYTSDYTCVKEGLGQALFVLKRTTAFSEKTVSQYRSCFDSRFKESLDAIPYGDVKNVAFQSQKLLYSLAKMATLGKRRSTIQRIKFKIDNGEELTLDDEDTIESLVDDSNKDLVSSIRFGSPLLSDVLSLPHKENKSYCCYISERILDFSYCKNPNELAVIKEISRRYGTINMYSLGKFSANQQCWLDALLHYIDCKIDTVVSDAVLVSSEIEKLLGGSFETIRCDIASSTQRLLDAIKNNNSDLWKKEQERFYAILESTIPKFLEKKDTPDYMRDYCRKLQKTVIDCLPDAALYAVNCIQPEADDRELIKQICCEDIARTIRNGFADLKSVCESVPRYIKLSEYKPNPCRKRLKERLLCPSVPEDKEIYLRQMCKRVADDFLKGEVRDVTHGDPHPLFSQELSDSVVVVDYFCEKYHIPNPFVASFGHALSYIKERQIGALKELSRSTEGSFPVKTD